MITKIIYGIILLVIILGIILFMYEVKKAIPLKDDL
jgi:hypothetical protein